MMKRIKISENLEQTDTKKRKRRFSECKVYSLPCEVYGIIVEENKMCCGSDVYCSVDCKRKFCF